MICQLGSAQRAPLGMHRAVQLELTSLNFSVKDSIFLYEKPVFGVDPQNHGTQGHEDLLLIRAFERSVLGLILIHTLRPFGLRL